MVFHDYNPSEPFSHPAAADFTPKYLYTGFSDPDGRPDVKIRDDFYGSRRKLRIGVLGAGLTGINFLHFATERLRDVEIVVYERNEEVGGVWFENKYPGCRCDIPSIVYQFSWRTNIWSEMYAPAKENLEYLKTVARENDFYKYIKLRHKITQASWTDEEAKWTLNVKDLESGNEFEDKVDIFLEFNGPVSEPRITPIRGIESFKGEVIHPTNWTDKTSVDGKKVAVIGYGSSGVQIIPNIIDKVDKLYTWYRNKTFVLPPPNQTFSGGSGSNFKYSEEQKELLSDPDIYLSYRKAVDEVSILRYSYIINGSVNAVSARENVVKYMQEKLSTKPEILEQILPEDFNIGCRRQTFAYGYLEAICDPKTTVLKGEPKGFTENGILTPEGEVLEVDMIIAATGFDQGHLPRYPKLVNGVSTTPMHEKYRSPPNYMGIATKSMPNYFNPGNAYSPAPQGNYYQSAEAFSQYIVKLIEKMQIDRVVRICPKDIAIDQWVRHANSFLKRTAMSGPCVSWYKGNTGSERPPALWPGARGQFLKVMEIPRFEDYDLVYENREDMFGFLGNGWWVGDFEETGTVVDVGAEPKAVEAGAGATNGEVQTKKKIDRTWYMGQPKREIEPEILEKLRGTDPSVQKVKKEDDVVSVPVV